MSAGARFWAKVDKSGECWLWTGAKAKNGYGSLRIDGRAHYAHRYALILTGTDPGSSNVDHICFVRNCVRPSHLRLATAKQNNENRAGANRNSRSGVRGVYYCNTFNKWFGSVTHLRRKYAKSFATAAEAADWCVAMRNELFTHNSTDRVA